MSGILFNTHLPVTEVFGPTWQGEGPHTGRMAHFLRLGHCNLHCEWCDTPETWDKDRFDLGKTINETPVEALWEQLAGAPLVVLTGGEPLMHQRRGAFSRLLSELEAPVHVETNGTIAPTVDTMAMVEHFTVSPKHATTADPERVRLRAAALGAFAEMAADPYTAEVCFKFVCRDAGEVGAVADVVERFSLPQGSVWVMPEGTTAQAVVAVGRDIAPVALAQGFNYSTRLHTLLWDDEKGR